MVFMAKLDCYFRSLLTKGLWISRTFWQWSSMKFTYLIADCCIIFLTIYFQLQQEDLMIVLPAIEASKAFHSWLKALKSLHQK